MLQPTTAQSLTALRHDHTASV